LFHERTLTVVKRTLYYSSVRFGGVHYITIGQETRVLVSTTRTVADPVGANARAIIKHGGTVVKIAEIAADAYDIYANPNGQRPMLQKHFEMGGRTAYNVGAGYATGKAAAADAKGGAALCALAAGAGALPCGVLGGLAAGIGASLGLDRLKKLFFG
jgi:hypothetical protein